MNKMQILLKVEAAVDNIRKDLINNSKKVAIIRLEA